MANDNIEIEIKFPLNNPKEVATFLGLNARKVSEGVHQKDAYYTPYHRDFMAVRYPYEWLRLRTTPNGSSITYKHFYPEDVAETDYCDEFETSVDDVSAMERIFSSLDFRHIVDVEKYRTTWMLEDVEIVIDDVASLGCYIELEATGAFRDPREGKAYLHGVLRKMGADVGEQDCRGYPFILIEKEKKR